MGTIILADDSTFQQRILSKYLREAGYEVHVANNGKEVLQLLETITPDCMIIDLIMPKMTGQELLQHFFEQGLNVPVIINTADIQRTTYEECMALGAFEVISKPVRRDVLLDLVEQAQNG